MGGVHTSGRYFGFLLLLFGALLATPSADAVEALDGRIQLHGFYENQTRVLSRNFDGTDGGYGEATLYDSDDETYAMTKKREAAADHEAAAYRSKKKKKTAGSDDD